MTGRVITGIAGAALVFAVTLPALASTPRFGVTEAGGSVFPGRAYVLSLPRDMHLKKGDVSVFENGEPVADVAVTAVGESKTERFGIVLVVDASNSMRGAPIKGAVDAAQAFATKRKPNQLLGVVTFNSKTTKTLDLTDNGTAIAQALATPPKLAYGTHIYDGVDTALAMLQSNHVEAGAVVVLSDGADTGSSIGEADIAAKARDAHVRIYTVGLHSRFLDRSTLKALARDVGGTFILARSTGSLAKIYAQLGSTLARAYLLHYRSLEGPGKPVGVAVRVAGLDGIATSAYETPQLAIAKVKPKAPLPASTWHRIWTSLVTTMLVGLFAAGLIGLGTVALLWGPRASIARRRLAEFVTVTDPSAGAQGRQRPTAQLAEAMVEGTGTMLRGSSWWHRFTWEAQIAELTLPPEQIVVLTGIASLLTLVFVKFFFGSLLASIVLAAAVPFVVRSMLKRNLASRRRRFAEQLPDNLQVLASALRAGHSFIGALSVVVEDAPEPARTEFRRVLADEQLGVPIDQALHVVVERMESRELEQVALVGALQHETGGNTAEVLDSVNETIRERFELRRTVQTLTAQGRMSRWVLTALPVILFLLINLINPGYMHVLYDSTVGRVLLFLAAISVTAGSLIIKRIINIKV